MTDDLEGSDLIDVVRRVADSLLSLPYETWNFGDSVAFDALIHASDALDDPRYQAFAHGWVRAWATRAEPFSRLDCTAPGRVMVEIARRTGDRHVTEAAARLADYLMRRPTVDGAYETWEHSPLRHPYGPAQLDPAGAALLADPPAGVFVDCLHFDPPFFAALGALTGEGRYWTASLEQANAYIALLQTESGLFDHFVLTGVAGRYGPGWGRGQGWALLGMLDVVESLVGPAAASGPEDDLRGLRSAIRRLVVAMCLHQLADGHWSAVVTDPTSGPEYSTAAFMAHGFVRAVELGIVPADDVVGPAQRALGAVRRGLDLTGGLQNVSAAVMACTEESHYAHVPRGFLVPWGQGPALLALVAHERLAELARG